MTVEDFLADLIIKLTTGTYKTDVRLQTALAKLLILQFVFRSHPIAASARKHPNQTVQLTN